MLSQSWEADLDLRYEKAKIAVGAIFAPRVAPLERYSRAGQAEIASDACGVLKPAHAKP